MSTSGISVAVTFMRAPYRAFNARLVDCLSCRIAAFQPYSRLGDVQLITSYDCTEKRFRAGPRLLERAMRFKNAIVFVTGGAGFIGSAVIRYLLAETDAFVVNKEKLTYAASLSSIPQSADNPRYRLAQVDIINGYCILPNPFGS